MAKPSSAFQFGQPGPGAAPPLARPSSAAASSAGGAALVAAAAQQQPQPQVRPPRAPALPAVPVARAPAAPARSAAPARPKAKAQPKSKPKEKAQPKAKAERKRVTVKPEPLRPFDEYGHAEWQQVLRRLSAQLARRYPTLVPQHSPVEVKEGKGAGEQKAGAALVVAAAAVAPTAEEAQRLNDLISRYNTLVSEIKTNVNLEPRPTGATLNRLNRQTQLLEREKSIIESRLRHYFGTMYPDVHIAQRLKKGAKIPDVVRRVLGEGLWALLQQFQQVRGDADAERASLRAELKRLPNTSAEAKRRQQVTDELKQLDEKTQPTLDDLLQRAKPLEDAVLDRYAYRLRDINNERKQLQQQIRAHEQEIKRLRSGGGASSSGAALGVAPAAVAGASTITGHQLALARLLKQLALLDWEQQALAQRLPAQNPVTPLLQIALDGKETAIEDVPEDEWDTAQSTIDTELARAYAEADNVAQLRVVNSMLEDSANHANEERERIESRRDGFEEQLAAAGREQKAKLEQDASVADATLQGLTNRLKATQSEIDALAARLDELQGQRPELRSNDEFQTLKREQLYHGMSLEQLERAVVELKLDVDYLRPRVDELETKWRTQQQAASIAGPGQAEAKRAETAAEEQYERLQRLLTGRQRSFNVASKQLRRRGGLELSADEFRERGGNPVSKAQRDEERLARRIAEGDESGTESDEKAEEEDSDNVGDVVNSGPNFSHGERDILLQSDVYRNTLADLERRARSAQAAQRRSRGAAPRSSRRERAPPKKRKRTPRVKSQTDYDSPPQAADVAAAEFEERLPQSELDLDREQGAAVVAAEVEEGHEKSDDELERESRRTRKRRRRVIDDELEAQSGSAELDAQVQSDEPVYDATLKQSDQYSSNPTAEGDAVSDALRDVDPEAEGDLAVTDPETAAETGENENENETEDVEEDGADSPTTFLGALLTV